MWVGPDRESGIQYNQFLDCFHEINVSMKSIDLLNKLILKYLVLCYFLFNDTL